MIHIDIPILIDNFHTSVIFQAIVSATTKDWKPLLNLLYLPLDVLIEWKTLKFPMLQILLLFQGIIFEGKIFKNHDITKITVVLGSLFFNAKMQKQS